MAQRHSQKVAWRFVRGYDKLRHMGVAIAIDPFPDGIQMEAWTPYKWPKMNG